jgi:hypothetical protein
MVIMEAKGSNSMNPLIPAFGFASGFWTALGLLPHLLFLCAFLIADVSPSHITPLCMSTIGTKLLGEWLFWKYCTKRMDSEGKLRNWRSVMNQSLFSHPNVLVALLLMFTDTVVDITLVRIALKTSIPPIWAFLALLGCQTLSSPFQGLLSDVSLR